MTAAQVSRRRIPRLDELEFDPHPHVYRWRGRELPSVTHVLRECGLGFQGSPGLGPLLRGQYVHEASVFLDENDLDWATVPEAYAGYLRGYERLIGETTTKPTHAEVRLFHDELGFAGTLDRIFLRRGARGIADIKSGSVRHAAIQISAYRKMWERWHSQEPISFGEYWKLNEDGSYRIEEVDLEEGWRDFCAALRVYRRRQDP